MKTNKISIKTNTKNYSIVIGRALIGKIDKIFEANGFDTNFICFHKYRISYL